MRFKKLYLDTCILVSYYDQKDKYYKITNNFFSLIKKKRNIKFFCSHFTITEFTWVLRSKSYFSTDQIFNIVNSLLLTNKIKKKIPFTLVDVKGKIKNYTFEDFFVDIQSILLNTTPRPGLADTIHAVIMKNNNINTIVSFDEKDFKNIEGIKVLNPETYLSKRRS